MTRERRPDRTLGPGHDEFWAWCERGELRLQRCRACARLSWPATACCQHCGGREFDWERLSGRGRVVSWSTFERDYYAGAIPLPYDNVLVELEEGPLFLSNPQGMTWRELKAGMAVQVTFLPCEDRAGPFSLPVFERA